MKDAESKERKSGGSQDPLSDRKPLPGTDQPDSQEGSTGTPSESVETERTTETDTTETTRREPSE